MTMFKGQMAVRGSSLAGKLLFLLKNVENSCEKAQHGCPFMILALGEQRQVTGAHWLATCLLCESEARKRPSTKQGRQQKSMPEVALSPLTHAHTQLKLSSLVTESFVKLAPEA